MDRQIDAVVVSTPDHTHAPASAMAMRMGKHCFCEKPLTHTVYEARTLAEIAREKKLATQMGTIIHATDNYRRVVELVQSGTIGPVAEVHVWCDKSWGGGKRPRGHGARPQEHPLGRVDRPRAVPSLPSLLPAGQLAAVLGVRQRHAGRHGLPPVDLPFWALKLRHPTTIAAEGPAVDEEGCPDALTVHYEFPARESMPAVELSWYDGGRHPALAGGEKIPLGRHGRVVYRQRGNAAGGLRQLEALSRGQIRRLQTARSHNRTLGRPPSRVLQRLQDGQLHNLQFRLLGGTQRGRLARQRWRTARARSSSGTPRP